MFRSAVSFFFLVVAAGCGPPPPAGPPEPDECSDPGGGTIDSLEIGSGTDPFTPLRDGEELGLVYGPQGGAMVPVRLRIAGAAPPECLPVDIDVMGPSYPFGSSGIPLQTYDQGDGTRATRPQYVIGDGGGPGDYTITATALGVTATVRLVLSSI